jgi:hypothetical protein
VFTAKGCVGVKVATVSVASIVTTPVTPGASVNVLLFSVVGFIAVVNVAVATAFGQTPIELFVGVTFETVGVAETQLLVPVVNVETKLLAIALPKTSCAAVVSVNVYPVLSDSAAVGVNV